MAEREIGLSEIAASRLGVAASETVELPTVEGPKRYRVAGIFHPRMINDTAVGDIVLVSDRLARSDWAAVRDQVAVDYSSPPMRPPTVKIFSTSELDCRCTTTDSGAQRPQLDHPLLGAVHDRRVRGDAAAGLSVLNVFLLGLVHARGERPCCGRSA